MKPAQKVLGGRTSVKVAVVQTPPVYLDLEKSTERACHKIAEAAGHGAELIVFTETWLAGYPYWGEGWESKLQNWIPVRVRFYDQAVLIPGEATEQLCHAAAQANAHVVIGCNELDSRRGVHTIYNTLLFIDRNGKILGRHRKTVPTFVERAVWGQGDGTDLITYETDIGRIGGLICGEHLMPLIRARMIEQGEDFHISVFPGAFSLHAGPKLEEADVEGRFFWGHSLTRAHAMEAGAFVLSACGYMTAADLPTDFPLRETVNLDYAHGGSQIVAPLGIPLVPPTSGDTIIYADCQADMIKVWKAIIDTVGHYARPDIVRLQYMKSADPSLAGLARHAPETASAAELDGAAERQGLSLEEMDQAPRLRCFGETEDPPKLYMKEESMSSNTIATGKDFFTIDPRRCALIVIDMQNAFVAKGAPFETPGARAMIPRLEGLIEYARSSGMPIVWTQSDHRPPYGGLMLRKFPAIAKDRVLWQGEPSFDLYPAMPQPREGELEYRILKHKFDAFFETDLDAILRYHHIDTIIITGTATNACCESTARSAFMRDYKVVFPSDLNATFDELMHQATLKNIDLLFGRVISGAELLAEMEAALETKSSS